MATQQFEETETKQETKVDSDRLELLAVSELQGKFGTFTEHRDTDKHCWEYKHETGQCQDILISNEFCQIAIGDGLIADNKEDDQLLLESETYDVPDPDIAYLNSIVSTNNPQLIDFDPNCSDFTITAEIYCDRDWGSRVFSNRLKNIGFELVVPRYKVKLISVFFNGGHINVGKTKVELKQWYHIGVTVKRSPNENIVKAYLNGHMDGTYSFPGNESLTTNGKGLIGSIGRDPNGNDSDHKFEGKIKNLKIWNTCLNSTSISQIAEGYEYKSDTTECKMEESLTFGYRPSSIQVEVPVADYIYNGPIDRKLEHDLAPESGNFTITAMIIPTRAYGSRVISSRSGNAGFEMVVPRYRSQVFSVWTQDGHVDIGETKLDLKKKMYHIACTVNRIRNSGSERTVISGYVNGKKDGGHVFYNTRNLNGGETWVGSRMGKEDKFDGCINNLRIYYKCLTATEIATIYAADIRDCNPSFNNNPNDYQYYIENLKKWVNVDKVNKIDFEKAAVNITLLTNTKEEKKQDMDVDVSLIKKAHLLKCIPGSDALKINNIGGTIMGVDFDGHKWKLITPQNGSIARHLMVSNALKLLLDLKPFPKYDFLRVLTKYNHGSINNGTKYLLNRLITCASILLKDVHNDSKKWDYLNTFILPWEIWSQNDDYHSKLKQIFSTNFHRLQSVARQLQKPYKIQQFELFDKLKSEKDRVAKIFSLKTETNAKYKICRQDAFKGGMLCECPKEAKRADEYDKSVGTKLLWGRCMILNEDFQNDVRSIYTNETRFGFEAGPVKTYERMVEKVIEYTNEGKDYPRAFQICDVLRNSITCATLDDVYDAFQLLKDSFEVVRVKNRFEEGYDANQTDGYRDMLVNIMYEHKAYNLKVICEIQFHLESFVKIKHKQHKLYKIMRANSYKTLLRNYEARKFDK